MFRGRERETGLLLASREHLPFYLVLLRLVVLLLVEKEEETNEGFMCCVSYTRPSHGVDLFVLESIGRLVLYVSALFRSFSAFALYIFIYFVCCHLIYWAV